MEAYYFVINNKKIPFVERDSDGELFLLEVEELKLKEVEDILIYILSENPKIQDRYGRDYTINEFIYLMDMNKAFHRRMKNHIYLYSQPFESKYLPKFYNTIV